MGKVKTTAFVFELPRKLGILQYVEYEPPRREWCTSDGCPYEGVLTAEGCRRGVCVKYKAWVFSKDGRRWEVGERWRKRRDEEGSSCLTQYVADAVLELAERGYNVEIDKECGIVINGIAVSRPRCRSVNECVRHMLEEYKRRQESPPPPSRRSPEEEEYEALTQQYGWLGWWGRNVVLNALKHNRRYLLDLLQRLNGVDVPHFVKAFPGRFNIDWSCLVEFYKSADAYCVSFCIKDTVPAPTTYCYESGKGWYHAPQPKFLRLRPLEGGRLVELYDVGGREMVRVV